ncbi:hypothetical protein GGP41_008404 [Bipolaris sorokiniana]|uniref:NAD-dependent epimerase/dehydratase domain-containing protein n=1 Tax=Cochliobolus sativus TaxID=45130 RepID=A0A8H5ZC43_COCSA|nr:hypothetical protein GGP41_008404 [Bipolaris sorokiniana]
MSACSSQFSVSPSATPEMVSTPATQSSVLFDDDVAADPLDIEGVSSSFIMVVGGLGYIGSHTTLELLKEGYNVLVIDDLSNSYQNVLTRVKFLAEEFCKEQGRQLPALHFQQLDYRSPQMKTVLANYSSYSVSSKPVSSLARRFPYTNLQRTDSGIEMETDDHQEPVIERRSRITGVIHFAAYKSVEESIRTPLRYYSNNVCGLVDFLGLIEEFGIKNFVFSSSATVYGEGANCGVPLREELCVHHPETFVDGEGRERQVLPGVLGLTSPYGRSKFMCESILADLAVADPTWSITALRYFNPVSPHSSEFPNEKMLTEQGTGNGHTVREVLHSLEEVSQRKIPAREVGRRAGDVGFCVAEVQRAETELQWKAERSLRDCAGDVWNFTKGRCPDVQEVGDAQC